MADFDIQYFIIYLTPINSFLPAFYSYPPPALYIDHSYSDWEKYDISISTKQSCRNHFCTYARVETVVDPYSCNQVFSTIMIETLAFTCLPRKYSLVSDTIK